MAQIYFDNSATTRPYDEVMEYLNKTVLTCYGNPSSLHNMGIEAEKETERAREIIAQSIGAKKSEIYFTSCGTESDNIAIIGYAMANIKRGRRIISTKIEHPAVLEPLKYLEENGFEVVYIGVDNDGIVNIDELEENLTKDTILVSIMSVNNEVGSRQPIEEIAELVREKCPRAKFHTDAVQAYGKMEFDVSETPIDMLAISAHKFHALKGAGALYIREKTIIKPVLLGGHQEKNISSGTQAVPLIGAMGVASEICYAKMKETAKKTDSFKKMLTQALLGLGDVYINGNNEGSPILNVSFTGLRSEVVLHTLEGRGIFVSSGSACASNKPAKSDTLTAMGMTDERIDSAIRFSFSSMNTEDEVGYTIDVLNEEIPSLRKYMRKK